MGCVKSANYAVLFNCCPISFFQISKRLRQGCHLSPLLFFLIVEGLGHILIKAKEEGKIKGVKVLHHLFFTHSIFVDDALLFGNGSLQEWSEY